MKAYYLSIRNDEDQGGELVFANTVQEARKQINTTDIMYDSWIDVQAHRWKSFDDYEHLPNVELNLLKWKDGWWWDANYPDPDEATDDEFRAWWNESMAHKNPTKELDNVITKLRAGLDPDTRQWHITEEEAKQDILDFVLNEIIGKYESFTGNGGKFIEVRNELRRELIEKVNILKNSRR